MKIIQTPFLKNVLAFALFGFVFFNTLAQSSPIELKQADSLFQAKQYIQSFELYSALLKEKHHSSAMLLKMAYIQEGLGHTSMSLYYLNLYYRASHDEQALRKMEEIASKNSLEGYQPSSFSSLFAWLQQYSFQIVAMLLSLIMFFFALLVYQKFKQQKKPVIPGLLLVFLLAVLFTHTHVNDFLNVAIVSEPSTYLMSGPSAGSSVMGIIDEGHLLKILGKTDVWIKVNWKDQEVYIKENSLLPVTL
ncbi:MAG: SH3 domain-containing protein [Bacteroidota bacterium]